MYPQNPRGLPAQWGDDQQNQLTRRQWPAKDRVDHGDLRSYVRQEFSYVHSPN